MPLTLEQVQATFRQMDRSPYPELDSYAQYELYHDLGPGGLFLVAHMVRQMNLKPGQIVLDLGCGYGISSVWLAKHFGVQVVAVDMWTAATTLAERFTEAGYRHQIVPMNLDARKSFPFAEAYFDAIFCMNSLSFYGGSVRFLQRLLTHLKPDGILSVGSECFDTEFTSKEQANPPAVFSWPHPSGGSVWADDFSKQHTAHWWQDLFEATDKLDILACYDLDEATILFEEQVLHDIEHGDDPDDVRRSIDQIEYGYTHSPHQSIFVITAKKTMRRSR